MIDNVKKSIESGEYFMLWNATKRRQGLAIIIDESLLCGLVEVRRVSIDIDGTGEAGLSEYIAQYDVSTLMNQFAITYKRAKALSNIISDIT